MKINFKASLLILTFLSGPAFAGTYASISGNLTIKNSNKFTENDNSGKIENKFNSGLNVALGYDFKNSIRIEAEGGYHAFGMKKISEGDSVISDKPKSDLKIMTLMGNAYYDFKNNTRFSPYIGAGAGVAVIDFPTKFFNTSKSKDTQFAYQFITGVSYALESIPAGNLYAGYRYFNVASPSFALNGGGNLKMSKIGASNLELGFRYNF